MKYALLSLSCIAATLRIFHCEAFTTSSQTITKVLRQGQPTLLIHGMSQNDNEDPRDDNEKLDDFLDKSFFEPDSFNEDDSGPLASFAKLVKEDYELAETLFAGSFFVVLVIITQELLRMQLYGDRYIPFTKLGSGGSLF